MRRHILSLAAAAAMCFAAGAASAGTVTNITLHPGDLGSTNVNGSSSSAPGFGNSSWQADSATLTPGEPKSELYIPVADMFSGSVNVGDIASISYWTNKPGNSGAPDWSVLIYTNPNSNSGNTGNEASWYQSRLNTEPYLTNTSSASDPSNAWHQWSSADANNPLRFYDAGRNGGVLGTYTDPTLSQITAGSVTWNGATENNSSYNYSSESVKFFSLQTGSGWANGFNGLADGLTVTLNNGDVANVNLEAVPLPKTAWGGLALMGGLGLVSMKKRMRRQMI